MPLENIKNIFQLSTKHARTPESSVMKKTHRSPVPAMNVKSRNESFATDKTHCDAPALRNGSKCTQVFMGTKTLVTDFHGVKSDNEFVNSLEDHIQKRGAMDKLTSDSAQSEISAREKDILRVLFTDNCKSEACHQHQSFVERRCQTINR